MPHIHLTILISARWSATSMSFLMGQISLPCNILLCTQLLYNLPLTIGGIIKFKCYKTCQQHELCCNVIFNSHIDHINVHCAITEFHHHKVLRYKHKLYECTSVNVWFQRRKKNRRAMPLPGRISPSAHWMWWQATLSSLQSWHTTISHNISWAQSQNTLSRKFVKNEFLTASC